MSQPPHIIDFNKVVEPHLSGATIISYKSHYLTKVGDNYGSIMLGIEATIRLPNGKTTELPLIAKLPPINNELYWKIFHPERTCITENAVYQYLSPALERLQLEAGIPVQQIFDGFPCYYGSRISLDPSATKVDRDAVLVQENLQAAGYKPGNRHKDYDLPHTRIILKYMADYHALPIALRIKKSDIHNRCVRPYYKKFNMDAAMGEENANAINADTLKNIESIANNNEKELARARELLQLYGEHEAGPDPADTPYTTIVHNDLWINNIMISYAANGTPEKVKIVDFQLAEYESLVHDLIFFLLSSVDYNVLDVNYESLLHLYYENFISCLRRVKVDITNYSYQSFLDEVKRVAHIQVAHALFMTRVIKADSSSLPEDYKDMTLSVLSKSTGLMAIRNKMGDILQLAQKFDIFY